MKLLLDSHALLWFLQDNPLLSVNAKVEIEDPKNQKFVSIATCWELKAGLKKLSLGEPSTIFFDRKLKKNNFQQLIVTLHHATAVETLPLHHRDPFDRLLIAQATLEQLPIVSCDAVFDQYQITRIW